MKKDFVALSECKFNIIHNEDSGLDGVIVDVKTTELSQIQRLIARLGGSISLYNCPLVISGKELEILTWLTYVSFTNVTITSHLNLTIEQYKFMLAGFGGNNLVTFLKPITLTMIDDTYLVLPDNREDFSSSFSETQSTALQVKREN